MRVIFALFFLAAIYKIIGRGSVRQSQNKNPPKGFRQDNRLDLERASEFLREQRGCNPSAWRNGKFNCRIGITCYTSLDFYPSSI